MTQHHPRPVEPSHLAACSAAPESSRSPDIPPNASNMNRTIGVRLDMSSNPLAFLRRHPARTVRRLSPRRNLDLMSCRESNQKPTKQAVEEEEGKDTLRAHSSVLCALWRRSIL